MHVSSGMVTLVRMSSMKRLQKNGGKRKEIGSRTESFLFRPRVGGTRCTHDTLVPNVPSPAIALVLSHRCDCLGTRWNSGGINK